MTYRIAGAQGEDQYYPHLGPLDCLPLADLGRRGIRTFNVSFDMSDPRSLVPYRRSRYLSAVPTLQGLVRAFSRVAQRIRQERPHGVRAWNKRIRAIENVPPRSSRKHQKRQSMRGSGGGGYLASGGLYAGRFSKRKRYRPKGVDVVRSRAENGGEANSGAGYALWFGTTADTPSTYGKYLFLAVLKRLAKNMGIDFRTEYDFIDQSVVSQTGDAGTFYYQLQILGEPEVVQRPITLSDSSHWGDLALAWINDVAAYLSGSPVKVSFLRCWIDWRTRDATDNYISGTAGRVDMKQMKVEYNFVDRVKIQNRTGANAPTEVDAENIEQNPLQGKIYELNGSKFELAFSNDTAISDSWVPSYTTGTLIINQAEASVNTALKDLMKRPMSGNLMSHVSGVKNIILQPGHIKSNVVTWSGTMNFNKFFDMNLSSYLTGSNSVDPKRFGKLQMFCLEKCVRTATGNAVPKIGYEHNQYHEFKVIELKKKPFITSFVDLTTV